MFNSYTIFLECYIIHILANLLVYITVVPNITCNILGKDYQLEYTKNVKKNGITFWGTLFSKRNFSFSFVIQSNSHIAFSPLTTEKEKKDAIISAININEETIDEESLSDRGDIFYSTNSSGV